ncbi:non-homologous end-joining DNA ligase [Kibdelosporangium phytohabitans]|uniref:ATP-dependent DNA ligase n=1 Tax=Kibdelosporangium phytohabitans TaxID=860235 RepID=A0A0N9HT11_9PSEU|nr:non-homologous end-joining DNA ligase [Kibdelosporangium phytohabitans]ALG08090.1 ATP-dependent DNA ligase [Kibdelosporangium phytohabitans]MBE1470934.1 bifunctional non-homologous end joining protein LigD [Kibdelosporangium phytohabitans]
MADQLVKVEDRTLKLTNMTKVLYPETGFTKAQVIDYYARIAPVLLPHLRDRPVTLRRYPNGVDGQSFFEKNVARHAPEWVRTERLPTPGSSQGNESLDFVLVQDLPTLVWVANLAALELHVPQWRVGVDPDLLVFDLDPGPPATVVECCQVALWLREELAEGGYEAYPKTSGSKGMQLYVPVGPDEIDTLAYSRKLAERLAREYPRQVVATMAKAQRGGKVFIDWSQNRPAKTTIAPYSLRARARPTVSTPVTWQEVEECDHVDDLTFTADEVRARAGELGDLLAYPRVPAE